MKLEKTAERKVENGDGESDIRTAQCVVCKKREVNDKGALIQCGTCTAWQHRLCPRLKTEDGFPRFFCEECQSNITPQILGYTTTLDLDLSNEVEPAHSRVNKRSARRSKSVPATPSESSAWSDTPSITGTSRRDEGMFLEDPNAFARYMNFREQHEKPIPIRVRKKRRATSPPKSDEKASTSYTRLSLPPLQIDKSVPESSESADKRRKLKKKHYSHPTSWNSVSMSQDESRDTENNHLSHKTSTEMIVENDGIPDELLSIHKAYEFSAPILAIKESSKHSAGADSIFANVDDEEDERHKTLVEAYRAVLEDKLGITRSSSVLEAHDLSGYWEKLNEYAFSKGGSSDIYKAKLFQGTHPHIEQVVAVKVLRSVRIRHGHRSDEVLQKRFQREVEAWSRLDHCNVVPFLGFAFEGHFPCLVAPWYENGDLTDYIRENPDSDRTQLVADSIDGLVYLHSLEPPVIHGDLKAPNILVDNDGKARIADFGLSRVLQEGPTGLTTSSTPGGTHKWMAPELLNGDCLRPTTASDVYALVLLALEIYTQKQPFPDLDQGRFFMAIYNKQSPQRSHYNPFNPPDHIWRVFEKGWSFDSTQRPSASELRNMFLDALAETGWR